MKDIISQQSKLKKYLSDLGLTASAPIEDIKRQYKRLAQKHHPDKGGNAVLFNKVAEAYTHLVEYYQTPDLPPIVALTLTYEQQIKGARGLKVMAEGEIIELDLPAGLDPKDVLHVETNKGTRVFTIKDIRTPGFVRQKYDLYATLDIDLVTALKGGIVTMCGPCGDKLTVDIPAGTNYNTIRRLRFCGLLNKATDTRGDLVIAVQYTVPALTEENLPSFIERLTKL